MKDPLDKREDPYQRFNDEAQAQGKQPQVSLRTKPMDVRRLFGPLRAQSKNPAGLQEARDKLTVIEKRLEQDVFYYWVDEQQVSSDGPLAEPLWEWDEPVPVPELRINGSFLRIVTGSEEQLLEPLRYRTMNLSELTRYDEAHLPPLEIVFEK
jgi:hypothetical protein